MKDRPEGWLGVGGGRSVEALEEGCCVAVQLGEHLPCEDTLPTHSLRIQEVTNRLRSTGDETDRSPLFATYYEPFHAKGYNPFVGGGRSVDALEEGCRGAVHLGEYLE